MLTLNLQKPGVETPRLQLSLNKGALFLAKLFWDSDQDLDAHALLARNAGQGAKVTDPCQILSTYNCQKSNPSGALAANPTGSFATPEGGLTHSGDSRSGEAKDVDEIITIDGAKVPPEVNEIPIFVTMHGGGNGARFAQVKKAGIRLEDVGGNVLGEFELSGEFASFNAVQMGSLMRTAAGGWEFAAVGNGFNGDFNTVLSHFT